MDDSLYALAAAFVIDELIPTLAALAVAAGREPLTWAVLAAVALPALWRRARASGRGAQRP
jgi:hypothetical protein